MIADDTPLIRRQRCLTDDHIYLIVDDDLCPTATVEVTMDPRIRQLALDRECD